MKLTFKACPTSSRTISVIIHIWSRKFIFVASKRITKQPTESGLKHYTNGNFLKAFGKMDYYFTFP